MRLIHKRIIFKKKLGWFLTILLLSTLSGCSYANRNIIDQHLRKNPELMTLKKQMSAQDAADFLSNQLCEGLLSRMTSNQCREENDSNHFLYSGYYHCMENIKVECSVDTKSIVYKRSWVDFTITLNPGANPISSKLIEKKVVETYRGSDTKTTRVPKKEDYSLNFEDVKGIEMMQWGRVDDTVSKLLLIGYLLPKKKSFVITLKREPENRVYTVSEDNVNKMLASFYILCPGLQNINDGR